MAALAQSGPRSPGVVVRVYEFEGDVSSIPGLAPNQAPSDVFMAETLDLNEKTRKIPDRSVLLVDGFVKAAAAGEYGFRLISDDGSMLWIDGALVVDHDGLHGATPKEGSIKLAAGEHALQVRYFQGTGDATLRLEWKPPGSGDFVLAPKEALSSEGAKDKASPGKKKIVAPLRRGLPGDGAPVNGPHPGFKSGGPFNPGEMTFDKLSSKVRTGISGNHEPSSFAIWMPNLGSAAHYSTTLRDAGPYTEQAVFVAAPGGESMRVFLDSFPAQSKTFKTYEQSAAFRFGPSDGNSVAPAGKLVFEMLGVRAMANGLEIEFTKPLDARCGWEPDAYYVEQWPYDATKEQPPTRDGVTYPVKSASVSEDRKRVFLEIPELKAGNVVYLRLLPPCLSEDGEKLWSTEAWYTLNTRPKERAGTTRERPALPPQNVLTDAEKAEGWRLLFDGKTVEGWHPFKKVGGRPEGWSIVDGSLVRTGPGSDVVSDDTFENFELKVEWRISPAGNSGIFYGVSEDEPNRYVWETGPEMQVLDNAEHADGRSPLTSAGSDYALYAPTKDMTRPVGMFNEARVVIRGTHVEHWLNGEKTVEYEWGSDDWKKRIEGSKFKSMPRYGTVRKGHLALQDHGDRVWFRNIKVRELKP
jgi:hypothetical protein